MRTLLLLMSLLVSSTVFADAVGLRASGGIWSYDVTGSIRDSATVTDTFDLKTELGMKEDDGFNGFIYIEHPVPVLPNFRIGIVDLKLAGSGTTTGGNKDFGGVTIPNGTNVNTSVDLSHTDIGIYYEVWDTGFDFDLGLNVKLFEGDATISDGGAITATHSYDLTVPMGYVHLGIPLVGGFKVLGDLSAISYDGDKIQDYLLRLRWDSDYLLGLELGYRSLTIDYADANEFADVKVDGPYFNLHLGF